MEDVPKRSATAQGVQALITVTKNQFELQVLTLRKPGRIQLSSCEKSLVMQLQQADLYPKTNTFRQVPTRGGSRGNTVVRGRDGSCAGEEDPWISQSDLCQGQFCTSGVPVEARGTARSVTGEKMRNPRPR